MHLVNGHRLRWSSSPLPSSLPRLNLSGSTCARDGSRQTAGAQKRASEEELDLGVAAAQLVLSPPGDCVVDCRIEPEKEASALRPSPHRRPHWQREPTLTTDCAP